MKTICAMFVLCCACAQAQISFTGSGLQTVLLNGEYTQFSYLDTLTVNLGTASNSQQDMDFSHLPLVSGQYNDTNYQSYLPPAGHLMSSAFPGATLCQTFTQVTTFSIYTGTITFVQYLRADNTGGYNVGGVYQQQWSPSPPPGMSDTTMVVHNNALGYPMPATLGTTKTWTDTTYDPTSGGTMTISSQTMTFDGYGNITYPDGRTLSSLRVLEDRTDNGFNNGVFQYHSRNKQVTYISQDFSQLLFDVDSTFSGGTTVAHDYRFTPKTGVLSVREVSNSAPKEFSLSQNYPNPFNPSTKISFTVAKSDFISLKVYNLLGQEVGTLVNQQMMPGTYEATFDASHLPSGLYLYRLSAGGLQQVRKMTFMK
ncbi:MAG: T9SS type A sorting domain-containing protein [Bacteroidota bacterium]|jgi:hypothetical protein